MARRSTWNHALPMASDRPEWTGADVKWMQLALDEGEKALHRREVPVGCVFVDHTTNKAVAVGSNRTNEWYNASAHAEFVAMDSLLGDPATRAEGLKTLSRCTLYVTVEPCIMCAGGLARAGVGRVIFGCPNDKFGGCGGVLPIHRPGIVPKSALFSHFDSKGGLLSDEAVALLRRFYRRSNSRAPKPQRGPTVAATGGAGELE